MMSVRFHRICTRNLLNFTMSRHLFHITPMLLSFVAYYFNDSDVHEFLSIFTFFFLFSLQFPSGDDCHKRRGKEKGRKLSTILQLQSQAHTMGQLKNHFLKASGLSRSEVEVSPRFRAPYTSRDSFRYFFIFFVN